MKLKKVTALLLATSMVISSVNVAPIFADEYIEEASFGTTEEASAEVDLSDDFGVTEDASDEANTATEEESFFDEEITDEVIDESTADEQVAVDEVAYEENADIYEALENAEATASEEEAYAEKKTLDGIYVDYNNTGKQKIEDASFEVPYTGTAYDASSFRTYATDGTTPIDPAVYARILDEDGNEVSPITAGDYTARFWVVDGNTDNYDPEAPAKEAKFTITQAELGKQTASYGGVQKLVETAESDPFEVVYTGSEINFGEGFEIAGVGSDTTMIASDLVDVDGDTKATDVGTYTFTVAGVEDGNYTEDPLTISWRIVGSELLADGWTAALVDAQGNTKGNSDSYFDADEEKWYYWDSAAGDYAEGPLFAPAWFEYTGEEINPFDEYELIVSKWDPNAGKYVELEYGVDYEIEDFEPQTDVTDVQHPLGYNMFTVKGIGNYGGEITFAWAIEPKLIEAPDILITLIDPDDDMAFVADANGDVVEFGTLAYVKSNNDKELKKFADHFKMVETKEVNGKRVYVADIPTDEYDFSHTAKMQAYVSGAYPFEIGTVAGGNYTFNPDPTASNFEWNILNYLPDGEKMYDGTCFDGIEAWEEKNLKWLTDNVKGDSALLKFVSYTGAAGKDMPVGDLSYEAVDPGNDTYYPQIAGEHVWTYSVNGGPKQTVTVNIYTLDVAIKPVFYSDKSKKNELTQPAEVGTKVYTDWVVVDDDEDETLKALVTKLANGDIVYDIKYGKEEITSSNGEFTIEEGDVSYTVTPIIPKVTKDNVAVFSQKVKKNDITYATVTSESDDVTVKRVDGGITWFVNGKETEDPFTATYDGTEYTFTAETSLTEEDPKYTVKVTGDTTAKNVGTGTAVATIYYDGEEDTGRTVEKLNWTIKAAEVTPVWYYKEKNATTWTKAAEEVSAPYSADGYELKALLEGEDSTKESEVFKTTVDVAENVYTGTATTKTSDYTIKKGTETFVLKMAKQEDNSLVVGIKNAKIAYGSDPFEVTFEFAYYLEGKETTDENIVKWMEEHKGEISYAISDLYTKTTPVGTYVDCMTAVVSKEIGRYTDPTTKKSYVVTGTTGDLEVIPATVTSIMWDDIKTFTYDGQTHDYPKAVVYGLNNEVVKVKSYFKDEAKTVPATEEKERGNYTVYIGELDNANYTLVGVKASDLKCAWSIYDDLSNLTAVYDSTMKYINTPTSTTLEYQFATNVVPEGTGIIPTFYQKEIPGAINAGTYRVYYQTRKAGTNDAFGNTAYAVLKIAPKPVTATLKIEPIPVNGNLPTDLTVRDFEINGIEAVDSKNEFFAGTGFKTDLAGYFISKAGTETRVANYATITTTSGAYDVNFAKDAAGEKYNNKSIIVHSKTVDGTTYSNYVVTAEKAAFTVGKVKVNIEWRVDDQKDYNTVEYRGTSHWVDAYIVSPAEYRGWSLDLMGDFSRTEVGTYTASITAADLKRFEIVSGGETFTWSITPKTLAVSTLMDKYNDGGLNVIAYGTADPTSTLGRNDLVFYGMNQITKKYDVPMTNFDYFDADDITGTPTFTTNYRQYNDVDMTGNLYHIDVDASALTAKNYKIVENQRAKLYVRKAQVTIVADNKNVGINATTMPKLTASFKDTVSGSKESAAAEHDFDAKVFTVEPTMDVYFPQTRGVYAIKVTGDDVNFTEPKRTYNELVTAGKPVNFEFQFTNGTYTVGEGDFEINLTDTRVAYDADPHTITGIPATLPNGIKIYYIDAEAKGFVKAETAKAVFEANAALASVDRVYKKEVGTHNVYWHIDGKDYGYDSYGVNKITIISNPQSEAERVAKLIEEAVKEPVDPAKVAEARKEYDALSDAAKKHPAVGDAIKKLEAAEKTIADEAAKQIAALLPADPSKAVDTDRPNYEQAQGIYDALSDAEKALIPGSKTALDAAKKAIEADEAAKEKAFVDAVAALPAPADAKATDRAAVDAAKALYDALTAAEKADPAVKDAKAKLDLVDAAVKAAEEGEDADKAAAKKVADMIEALPAPEDVTVDDENAIKNAVDAFDALTEAQQALVPEADQEKLAADVLALAAAIVKEAEDQAAADEIEALIDAIAKSEPGDGKAAMEAAKAAYEAATDDVKAKVDNGHKEVLDDAIECYKKDTTFNAGRGVYRVLSNGDVTYVKPLYPEDTYFQVPNDVVCPEGFPFKVVKVSVNAFKGCTNVTKIWMGKNIVTIGKYAFKGATNLRTLIVRTQDIDVTEKIENAFAGMAANRNGKVNVQIWEKMLSKYEPMFRGAGKLPAKAYFTTID